MEIIAATGILVLIVALLALVYLADKLASIIITDPVTLKAVRIIIYLFGVIVAVFTFIAALKKVGWV